MIDNFHETVNCTSWNNLQEQLYLTSLSTAGTGRERKEKKKNNKQEIRKKKIPPSLFMNKYTKKIT